MGLGLGVEAAGPTGPTSRRARVSKPTRVTRPTHPRLLDNPSHRRKRLLIYRLVVLSQLMCRLHIDVQDNAEKYLGKKEKRVG